MSHLLLTRKQSADLGITGIESCIGNGKAKIVWAAEESKMSAQEKSSGDSRLKPVQLKSFKRKNDKLLVCLTAYTAPVAEILDKHAEVLLVGDSLGMVVYGFDNTLPVTLDMMIQHGAAVVRASKRACVVVDLPFGSYEGSKEAAFNTASRMLRETQAQAVKLEGGEHLVETVGFLTTRGIPVMGHIGLTPQAIKQLGSYGPRGRSETEAESIRNSAKALEEAGAFSIVLEGVPVDLAADLAAQVDVPIIGIGAGHVTDGQILVSDDMFGLFRNFKPKFVRRFGNVADVIDKAAGDYRAAVLDGTFPGKEETYK